MKFRLGCFICAGASIRQVGQPGGGAKREGAGLREETSIRGLARLMLAKLGRATQVKRKERGKRKIS